LQTLLSIVEIDKAKISRKKRPTLLLRADDRISKMPAESLRDDFPKEFRKSMIKESSFIVVNSLKDLAERIREGNRGLNDTTIVYCQDPTQSKSEAYSIGMRLMH